MPRNVIILLLIFQFMAACVKKQIPTVEPVPTKQPMVKFVFVNRIGFRNDSTKHGVNDTVFSGGCFNVKYYDKPKNLSYIGNTCYNRNFPPNDFPLSDSINFREYEANNGDKYQFQIDLIWRLAKDNQFVYGYRYNLKSYPSVDSIKVEKDTIIKFVWPDDTASGRYVKGVLI